MPDLAIQFGRLAILNFQLQMKSPHAIVYRHACQVSNITRQLSNITILLGNKVILLGNEVILLGNEVILLGR